MQDWADTWLAITEGHSIRAKRRIRRRRKKKKKKNGRVIRPRQCIRKQRQLIADVAREKSRTLLREATSITLALDECKYKKVVRFRCDTPAPVADGQPAVGKVA